MYFFFFFFIYIYIYLFFFFFFKLTFYVHQKRNKLKNIEATEKARQKLEEDKKKKKNTVVSNFISSIIKN